MIRTPYARPRRRRRSAQSRGRPPWALLVVLLALIVAVLTLRVGLVTAGQIRRALPAPLASLAERRPREPAVVGAPAAPWPDAALQAQLEAAIPPDLGRVAVAVRNLRSGASAAVDADVVMPPASLFKLGVLVETFRQIEAGRLSLDESLLLTWDDWADGAGVLQARIGERVEVAEALRLMIGISDNTAALALLHRLGADAVNAGYVRLGLAHSRIYPDDRPDTTTAAETATLLASLAAGQLAGPALTQQMLDLLALEQPQAWIRGALPPQTAVAHKSGQLPGVRNDVAIVYAPSGPYVLVVLADDLADQDAGEAMIGAIAQAVHGYFGRRP